MRFALLKGKLKFGFKIEEWSGKKKTNQNVMEAMVLTIRLHRGHSDSKPTSTVAVGAEAAANALLVKKEAYTPTMGSKRIFLFLNETSKPRF